MDLSSLIQYLPTILNFLQNFSKDNSSSPLQSSFETVLKGLGLEDNDLSNVISLIKNIISGEVSLKTLLPALAPVIISFLTSMQTKNAPENNSEAFEANVKLQPLENFANDEIYSSLYGYFENDSAS